MKISCDGAGKRLVGIGVFAGVTLAVLLCAGNASGQAQSTGEKAAESKPVPVSYQIFYLKNATRQTDLNDIQTDLRNMLPKAKIYGVQSQNALSIQGSAEDLAQAEKMIAELDKPRKVYRLTYTVTEMDGGKLVGAEHFVVVVASSGKTTLKQGSRVPIVTGSFDTSTSMANTQVQYQDVGLTIDASLDGESLHTKVEQTSMAEEKSGVGTQDPIVRQTVLDAMTALTEKAQVLGAIDVPGSTRHEEIEVVSELVR